MRDFSGFAGLLAILTSVSGCTRSEPPAGTAQPQPVQAPTARSSVSPKRPSAKRQPVPPASAAEVVAALDAGPPEPAVPALLDATGKALPQTEDRPSVDSAWFRSRGEKLFQSIVKDDPESSLEFFFPLVAYEQVKDVGNPARDYQYRLIKNFKRDVHEYHRLVGENPEQAKFVGIEVPEAQAKWMKPGSEGNKLGYFRVLRSRLRFADSKGKERELEITSFISWRGEWYLVHLHGFK
jgi:hypothetical protein